MKQSKLTTRLFYDTVIREDLYIPPPKKKGLEESIKYTVGIISVNFISKICISDYIPLRGLILEDEICFRFIISHPLKNLYLPKHKGNI